MDENYAREECSFLDADNFDFHFRVCRVIQMGAMGVQRKKRASWDGGKSDEGFLGLVSIITGCFLYFLTLSWTGKSKMKF